MKKYIIILAFLISSTTFSQNITSKTENISPAQRELLKKIHEYYPDISISDKVNNFYVGTKIIDSKQEFAVKGTEFSSYELSISPDNKRVVFEFISKKSGKSYGVIVAFKGKYVRTTFSENLGQVVLSINGKTSSMNKI